MGPHVRLFFRVFSDAKPGILTIRIERVAKKPRSSAEPLKVSPLEVKFVLKKSIQDLKMNRAIFVLLGFFAILAGGLYWVANIAWITYRVVLNSDNFPKLAGYSLILPILITCSLYPFLKRFPDKSSSQKEPVNFMKRPISFMQSTMALLFLASFFIGWGLVSAVNSHFDGSTAQIYKEKVIIKRIWHSRFGKDYELKVTSWFNKNADYKIKLSRDEYDHIAVVPGDPVYIGIGKGALGLDWIASIAKDATGPDEKTSRQYRY